MKVSHRKTNRFQNYDYSQNSWYFLTICTKNFTNIFGEIINEKMILNKYGKIVEQQWKWLQQHFDYVQLDSFIVMPNHFHGVLIINRENSLQLQNTIFSKDNPRVVLTNYERRFNLLSKTINAFKTTSSKLIHQNGLKTFAWHRSFYDHIIRKTEALEKIREYIYYNPLKWLTDKHYKT